ncbi:hypothetical protein [Eubacterium sp. 1001713B170207_170306_E7]|nr:hypothetical protein [Eubacterium sp. 1001713B170207_170306_E7]
MASYIPPPGVYKAELRYSNTSLDDLRPLNSVITKTKLTVQ